MGNSLSLPVSFIAADRHLPRVFRAALVVMFLLAVSLPDSVAAQTAEPAVSAVSFVSTPVGTASAPNYVNFVFLTGGSLGSLPTVLTQGAAGLDFTDTGTGSCTTNGTAHVYRAGESCIVTVMFTPKYSGSRAGAVQLIGANGTVAATEPLSGIGTGPQVIFNSNSPQSLLDGGFNYPSGMAVDTGGNVFLADTNNAAVKEIPAGCSTATCVITLGGGFNSPHDVAVGGGGNVFVADNGGGIKEIPPGCFTASCVITLGVRLITPYGIAVDSYGNVFATDISTAGVTKIPPGCNALSCTISLGGGFSTPEGLAVDANGDVFVADTTVGIKEIPSGCFSAGCVVNLGGGIIGAYDVAVDAAGNVFVAGGGTGLQEIPPGCSAPTCVLPLTSGFGGSSFSNFSSPIAVAVGPNGNIFVTGINSTVLNTLDFADPPSLSFAATAVGATSSDSPQLVTIANDGNTVLAISSLAASNNNFTIVGAMDGTVSACGATLAVGASCGLAVSFTPTASGALTGTANIVDNSLNAPAPGYATQSIAVSGTGKGQGNAILLLSPGSIPFSSQPVGSTGNAWTANLSNESGSAAAITSIVIAGSNPSEFSETNSCGTSLAAYSSCNILVTFHPDAAASFTGTLVVTADAKNSPLTSALSGTGTSSSPTVVVSPGSINFSNQPQGTTGNPWTVTLSNTSAYTLNVGSIKLSDANDFTLANSCGATLAAYSTCTLQVGFTPQSAATITGTLTFTDNASTGSGVQTVTLNGTGTTSSPALLVSPTSIAFGNQQVGTTGNAWTVNISNTSGTAATFTTFGMSNQSGDFIYTTTCGKTLAAYSSCTVMISFKPLETVFSSVAVSGQFSFSYSGGATQTVSLSGTVTPSVPAVQISTTNINFGSQAVGTSTGPWTVTLSNTSNTAASISVSVFPNDFSDTTTCGSTLAAYSTCIVQITFSPTIATSETGALLVELVNTAGGGYTVPLTGTGVAQQAPFFSPASISFGNQAISTSNTWVATYNNPSGLPVQLLIPPAGSFSPGFSQTNNCPATLPAYSNCNFQITFAPTSATGAYSASLITSATYLVNGSPYGGSVQTLALTGNSVPISQAVYFSTSSINFGSQAIGTTSNPWTITLNNTGNGLVALSSAISLSNAGNFTQTSNCPAALPAYTNCNVLVSFNPTSLGNTQGTLNVSVDGTPLSVNLTGAGTVAPDYSLTVAATTLTLAAGQTGNARFTFTPVGGYAGTVSFTCTGLPAGSTCSFQPSSLTANGSNTVQTSNLLITTTGPSAGTVMLSFNRTGAAPLIATILFIPGLAFGCMLTRRRRTISSQLRGLLYLLLLAFAIGGSVGCGSFSNIITPPGTNTVTMVGSATATSAGGNSSAMHAASFTLIIKN